MSTSKTGSVWQLIVCATALIAVAQLNCYADSGTWIGTQNAAWTNSTNWSSALYPGSAPGESATFTAAPEVIDIDNLTSIGSILFTDSGFTLGYGGAGVQTLVLEDNGQLLQAENISDRMNIDASVCLGVDRSSAYYGVFNNSLSHLLTFSGLVSGGPPIVALKTQSI